MFTHFNQEGNGLDDEDAEERETNELETNELFNLVLHLDKVYSLAVLLDKSFFGFEPAQFGICHDENFGDTVVHLCQLFLAVLWNN